MVKLPEKAPDWQKIIQKKPSLLVSLEQSHQVKSLLEKVDAHYYYWDKIKYQTLPKEIKQDEFWAFVRYRRHLNRLGTPLLDIEGEPFTFWLPEALQQHLYTIDQNTKERLFLHEKKVSMTYTIGSLIEEAITSSQIEGAVATIRDAKEMLLSKRKPKDVSEQMIFNNYITMQSVKELCKHDLSRELLFELHATITKDTLESREQEGKFRTNKENINVMTTYGEILFKPPPAEEIEKRIDALCRFANDRKNHFHIHPILKAILLHFWMAYIHPFVDGNGRLARTLFYWYVIRHGYSLFEYISISKLILKRTTQYARAYLYSETDGNDLTYFLHFHLDVLTKAIAELQKYVEENESKEQLAPFPEINVRQARLLQYVQTHPKELLTIAKHKNAQGISYQTARTDLLKLVSRGFLKQVQRGNKFYFELV